MIESVYQDILESILKALVNHPDEVEVKRTLDEMGVLLTVKVNPQDMGLIVGRKGDMIKSLRTLMRTIGLRHHARVNIKLDEPVGGSGGHRNTYQPRYPSRPHLRPSSAESYGRAQQGFGGQDDREAAGPAREPVTSDQIIGELKGEEGGLP